MLKDIDTDIKMALADELSDSELGED